MTLSRKPVIGITTRMNVGSDRFYLRKNYSEAVHHAGGIPVLLPLIPEAGYVRDLINSLDGVLLPGSNSDVDPHRYQQEPDPHLGPVMSCRDQTDWNLLQELFQQRKPLLGVCYGIQILNVFLGGTLWQDIAFQVDGSVKHSQDSAADYKSHSIEIKSGSVLFSLAGETKTKVNSYHHQAIRTLAPPLEAVASAPDGIVEAVELKGSQHPVLAVQWHPEIGWESDQLSQKIFSWFVGKARELAR